MRRSIFLAVCAGRHNDRIVLAALTLVHRQRIGQRERASNFGTEELRLAVRGKQNVNKRAAALHRLNMRRANIPVEAAFFTIVLENHDAVVFADGNAIMRNFRFSFSRRIDHLLELLIQSFDIASCRGDGLNVLASEMPLYRFLLNHLKNVTFAGRNQCEGVIEFQFFGITELREIRNIIKQCSFLVRLTVACIR